MGQPGAGRPSSGTKSVPSLTSSKPSKPARALHRPTAIDYAKRPFPHLLPRTGLPGLPDLDSTSVGTRAKVWRPLALYINPSFPSPILRPPVNLRVEILEYFISTSACS